MNSTHPVTDLTVPSTQRTAVFDQFGGPLRIVERPVVQESELQAGEVLVKMMYSGVCHTDLHIFLGDIGLPAKLPLVGGHEGAGFVVAIGAGTQSDLKIGQAVGVSWLGKSCMSCEACTQGEPKNEPICSSVKNTGSIIDGTFQQYAVSYASHVIPIPESIPLHLAAPVLCAGVTVYKAIQQANTKPGDIIVISGAGGGLGHLAIQYAANGFGLRVIAIDTGDSKRELCLKLGAETFVDFRTSPNVVEELRRAADGIGAHAVVVTSGSSSGYSQVLDYLRPGGSLIAVGGAPGAKLEVDITSLVGRCITIRGSCIGNRDDCRRALGMAAQGHVHTTCHIEPLDKLSEIFNQLKSGALTGRVVVDLWK